MAPGAGYSHLYLRLAVFRHFLGVGSRELYVTIVRKLQGGPSSNNEAESLHHEGLPMTNDKAGNTSPLSIKLEDDSSTHTQCRRTATVSSRGAEGSDGQPSPLRCACQSPEPSPLALRPFPPCGLHRPFAEGLGNGGFDPISIISFQRVRSDQRASGNGIYDNA